MWRANWSRMARDRPRKMLRLTPRGREAFAEWVRNPVEHGRDFRLEFLAKLYFATQVERSTLRRTARPAARRPARAG